MAGDEMIVGVLRDALAHEEIGWISYKMALDAVRQPIVRAELARLARDSESRAALLRRLLRDASHRER